VNHILDWKSDINLTSVVWLGDGFSADSGGCFVSSNGGDDKDDACVGERKGIDKSSSRSGRGPKVNGWVSTSRLFTSPTRMSGLEVIPLSEREDVLVEEGRAGIVCRGDTDLGEMVFQDWPVDEAGEVGDS